jgi:hypothetical protein
MDKLTFKGISMQYKDLLLKILGLCVISFSHAAMAIDENGIYTRQDVLEEYAEGLSYLDNKVFIYEVDLSGNGYNDILLSTDDSLYTFSRYGHKQFSIYTRLASGNEDYFLRYELTLTNKDDLGTFSAMGQKYIQSYGLGKIHYHWIDRNYKLHTTNNQPSYNAIVEPSDQFNYDDFKALYSIDRFLKQTLTVENILPADRKALKQTYADSVDSKLFISGASYMTLEGEKRSRKYEWVEKDERVYLGDYIGSKRVFYPASEEVAEKFYKVVVQKKSSLKKMKDGTVLWKYKPVIAPEWAEAHPEVAEKLKQLSESCLPREICVPTNTEKVIMP